MAIDENPFLLPPPAPPERKTLLRVILLLSAAAHVGAFTLASRSPAEKPAAPGAHATETMRVLQGEVSDRAGEPGLRLSGYAEVAVPRSLSPASGTSGPE